MREDWTHLEGHRASPRGYESKPGDKFGWFIWMKGKTQIRAMAVDGAETGWEHVSVTVAYLTGKRKWVPRIPKWEEMCVVKSMFWADGECVIQYHPPEENYVNITPNCLHLWRSVNAEFPMPPTICV